MIFVNTDEYDLPSSIKGREQLKIYYTVLQYLHQVAPTYPIQQTRVNVTKLEKDKFPNCSKKEDFYNSRPWNDENCRCLLVLYIDPLHIFNF